MVAVLGAIFLVLAGVGATGAGVVPFNSDDSDSPGEVDTLDTIDGLVAYPSPEANGAYATLGDDGKIAIDLTSNNPNVDGEGVPPEAFTGIDDVFRLEYTGDEGMTIWLETDEERITFYTDTGTIDGDNPVTLEPDESIDVGFSVDSEELSAGEQLNTALQIHTDGSLTGESTSPSPSLPGPCLPASIDVGSPDELTRSVSVTNVQPCQPEQVDLKSLPIGEVATLESIELEFDRREDVSFEVEATPVGERFGPAATLDDFLRKSGVAPIGSYQVVEPPATDLATEKSHNLHVVADWLDAEGIDPGEVSLYAAGEDGWQAVETTVESPEAPTGDPAGKSADDPADESAEESELNDVVRFEAATGAIAGATEGQPAGYALGFDAPVVSVADAGVDVSDSAGVGDELPIRATLVNDGPVDAAVDLELLVDGEPAGVVSETVPADGSTDVTLAHAFDEPGSYDLGLAVETTRVGGSFVVDEATVDLGTATVETDDVDVVDESADDGADGLPFGVGGSLTIAMLALAGATALYVWRN